MPLSLRWSRVELGSSHPRNKWGHQFETYPSKDPYHYPLPLMQDLPPGGFHLDVVNDFGHPTQTMGRFRQRRHNDCFFDVGSFHSNSTFSTIYFILID